MLADVSAREIALYPRREGLYIYPYLDLYTYMLTTHHVAEKDDPGAPMREHCRRGGEQQLLHGRERRHARRLLAPLERGERINGLLVLSRVAHFHRRPGPPSATWRGIPSSRPVLRTYPARQQGARAASAFPH